MSSFNASQPISCQKSVFSASFNLLVEQVGFNLASNSSRGFNQIEKLNQSKKAFMQLLEVLNAKFAGELKKVGDSAAGADKEIKFLYSKFSPVADCIRQSDKVSLRDMLSLV